MKALWDDFKENMKSVGQFGEDRLVQNKWRNKINQMTG